MDFPIPIANFHNFCGVYSHEKIEINASFDLTPNYKKASVVIDPWNNSCLVDGVCFTMILEKENDSILRVWALQ